MKMPSHIVQTRQLSADVQAELTVNHVPFDGVDDWTAYQFDVAVQCFGSWVENKLNTIDADGQYPYTLNDLLNDKPLAPYKKREQRVVKGKGKNVKAVKQAFQNMGFHIEKLPSGKGVQ